MMIETTVRYGHGAAGMIVVNLNESALERWERSLHVSSVLEQNLLGLKGNKTNKNVTHLKEESKARMKIDSTDRDKLRKYLVTSRPCLCRWSPARNTPHTFRNALNLRNKHGFV